MSVLSSFITYHWVWVHPDISVVSVSRYLVFCVVFCRWQFVHEARAFNFTYRYIDDVLSINNSRFAEFLPLIYFPELEVKETTYTASSASFLDLYLEFDDSGQLSTKIYENFVITLICPYSFGHYVVCTLLSSPIYHCHNLKVLNQFRITKLVKHHTLDIYLIYATA